MVYFKAFDFLAFSDLGEPDDPYIQYKIIISSGVQFNYADNTIIVSMKNFSTQGDSAFFIDCLKITCKYAHLKIWRTSYTAPHNTT